jgi:ABC-type Fe3+ transport system substrate-binding protein
VAVLTGAKHPRAARAFIEFLLTERGQRVFMERGLFPLLPKYKVRGPTGSVAEKAVEFTGGVRSYFDTGTKNVYDEEVAQKRYQEVNERFQKEIEAVWGQPKR